MLKHLRTLLVATVATAPLLAWAQEPRQAGLITANSVSTIVSTKELGPGALMSMQWISMPAGERMSQEQYIGKWATLALVLSGTSVSRGDPPPGACFEFIGGTTQDVTGREVISKPGDGFGCVYAPPSAYWEENRSAEPLQFAQLAVGVGHPDDPHTTLDYERAGGFVYNLALFGQDFEPVNDALRAAGAMTLAIRNVTMPAGSSMFVADEDPVLRLVTTGQIRWGRVPAGSVETTKPQQLFGARMGGWIGWAGPRRAYLANETDKPAQFIEWSVAPAPGAAP